MHIVESNHLDLMSTDLAKSTQKKLAITQYYGVDIASPIL